MRCNCLSIASSKAGPIYRKATLVADSRRLLLELIDDLLVVAREAASETRSLGRLVERLYSLDLGKAQTRRFTWWNVISRAMPTV